MSDSIDKLARQHKLLGYLLEKPLLFDYVATDKDIEPSPFDVVRVHHLTYANNVCRVTAQRYILD